MIAKLRAAFVLCVGRHLERLPPYRVLAALHCGLLDLRAIQRFGTENSSGPGGFASKLLLYEGWQLKCHKNAQLANGKLVIWFNVFKSEENGGKGTNKRKGN